MKLRPVIPNLFRQHPAQANRLQRLALAWGIAVALCLFLDLKAFQYFEQYAYDVRMSVFSRRNPGVVDDVRRKVVLVPVTENEKNLRVNGMIPRDTHGEVLRHLAEAGANVVAFDYYFAENKPEDDRFLQAVNAAGNRTQTVTGCYFPHPFGSVDPVLPDHTLRAGHLNYGILNVLPGTEQQIIERAPLFYPYHGAQYVSLSEAAVLLNMGATGSEMRDNPQGSAHQLGQSAVPTDADHAFNITYFGLPARTFPTIPYAEVLSATTPAQIETVRHQVEHAIVLVGEDTDEGNDNHQTPVGVMRGMEIHAHAIATLLSGIFICNAPWWLNAVCIVLLPLCVGLCLSLFRLRWALWASLAVLGSYFVANVALFVDHGLNLHLVAPLAAAPLVLLWGLIDRGLETDKQVDAWKFDAFISYRRDGGADTARLIRDAVQKQHFKVFLDVEDLGSHYFDERILTAIESAPNFILILTPGCLDRCAAEEDWLRREIHHAMTLNRNIIPILKDGFEFPPAEQLPPEMQDLPRYNSVVYSHTYYEAMIEKLLAFCVAREQTAAQMPAGKR